MTILEKIKFEEDWLSEVNLTKENVKIAFDGIRATALEQQQQPCEDCISREAVLDIINFENEWLFDANSHNADTKIAFSTIKSKITKLPSVTPKGVTITDFADRCRECGKQKVGKWIKTYEPNDAEPFILWECSECQNAERGRRNKYCPNCGTKMESEEDEE